MTAKSPAARQPSGSATPFRDVPKLLLFGWGQEPIIFPLIPAEVLIGRLYSVDLVLEDPAVSRIHAKIVREGSERTLVDLESSTGTFVNGSPVGRHVLCDGDVIQIASIQMEYRT